MFCVIYCIPTNPPLLPAVIEKNFLISPPICGHQHSVPQISPHIVLHLPLPLPPGGRLMIGALLCVLKYVPVCVRMYLFVHLSVCWFLLVYVCTVCVCVCVCVGEGRGLGVYAIECAPVSHYLHLYVFVYLVQF